MSRKRKCCCERKRDCCCERKQDCCCETNYNSCCDQGVFNGVNGCVEPIIFLLIACASGLLNNNCSFLIILLFLLFGNSFGSIFGGEACC